MRRDVGAILLLILLVGNLGLIAWLSHHPDAPLLRRAEEWPLVGPAACWFRSMYLPPSERGRPDEDGDDGEDGADDGGVEVVYLDRRAPEWEPPPPPGPRQVVWVLPGTVMRAAPSPTAAPVHQFDAVANTFKRERRGDWFRVRYLGDEGWVYLEGYDESGGPPYGIDPDLPRPMPPQPPAEERLAAALELFTGRQEHRRLGPYDLYTDCPDGPLLHLLDRLAAQVEPAYRERYDRLPIGSPQAALVLYRSELPYRVLQGRSEGLLGLDASGHAGSGLAIFYLGDRDRGDVAATLVHELVHLLNRRALGPALPPWLDEGLADDLAASKVGDDGTLHPHRLGGQRIDTPTELRIGGALATLHSLHRAAAEDRLPPLRHLLGLDQEGFVRGGEIRLHYGMSGFFVRYLLEAEDRRHAEAFRSFLDGVAAGRPATAEELRRHLGLPWQELDRRFRGWIDARTEEELGELLPRL